MSVGFPPIMKQPILWALFQCRFKLIGFLVPFQLGPPRKLIGEAATMRDSRDNNWNCKDTHSSRSEDLGTENNYCADTNKRHT